MVKVKSTTYPKERPNFNDWCEMFKVSSMYIDREGMNKANRIMSLWDGFAKTKQYFVSKIKESDE